MNESDINEILSMVERDGFRVIPLDVHNVPLLGDWPEQATNKKQLIIDWFTLPWRSGDMAEGVGIVTGNDGLFVVDLDVKDDRNGIEEWERLGIGYETRTVRTRSGGLHLYYVTNEPPRNSRCGIAEGIDIRGHHGFVAAPPTPGYTWRNDLLVAQAHPKLLKELARTTVSKLDQFDAYAKQASTIKPARQDGNRPGDAYNATVTTQELLEQHGWQYDSQTHEGIHYTRPGKSRGVSATVWSDNGRCTIWSTQPGLKVGGWLDAFGLLAELDYNGDLGATSRALAAKGYGTVLDAAPSTPVDSAERAADGGSGPDDTGAEWGGWQPADWNLLDDDSNPIPSVLQVETFDFNKE